VRLGLGLVLSYSGFRPRLGLSFGLGLEFMLGQGLRLVLGTGLV
jgi:hypothetical protein